MNEVKTLSKIPQMSPIYNAYVGKIYYIIKSALIDFGLTLIMLKRCVTWAHQFSFNWCQIQPKIIVLDGELD